MKLFKGYKAVAVLYLIITVINIVWVVNYEKPNDIKQVNKQKDVVLNA